MTHHHINYLAEILLELPIVTHICVSIAYIRYCYWYAINDIDTEKAQSDSIKALT